MSRESDKYLPASWTVTFITIDVHLWLLQIINYMGLMFHFSGNDGESYPAPEVRDNDVHQEAISFYPKYMGSTLVEELVDPEPGANYYNTGLSTKALDRIVRMVSSILHITCICYSYT